MPANNYPIYSRVADIQWANAVSAANNTQTITSGTSYLVFTADTENGGFVETVRVKADPANNTAQTVLRLWLNNGATTTVSTNSALIAELTLYNNTASATVGNPDFAVSLNIPMPPGYKLYCTLGTAAGGSGQFTVTAFGGKY